MCSWVVVGISTSGACACWSLRRIGSEVYGTGGGRALTEDTGRELGRRPLK